MKEQWLVIAVWQGTDIDYGVAHFSYLLWVADTEEEAKIYIESYVYREKIKKIFRKYAIPGKIEAQCLKWSNGNDPLCIGGAAYIE